MPDENTYYWLYNEDMTKFIRFKVFVSLGKDQRVSILEYKIQSHHTLEEAGCPIEPIWLSEQRSIKHEIGQELWMGFVREGWRMMIESVGRIEQQDGMATCWVTLNSTKVNV